MTERNVFRQEDFDKKAVGAGSKSTPSPRFYYFPHSVEHEKSTGHVAWMIFDRYISHYPDTRGGSVSEGRGTTSVRFPNQKEFSEQKQNAYGSKFATYNDDMAKYSMHWYVDIGNLKPGGAGKVSQYVQYELTRSDSVYALNDISYMASDGKKIGNVKRSNCVTTSMRVLCSVLCNMKEIPSAFLEKHPEFKSVTKHYPNFREFIRKGDLNECYQVGHLAGIVRDLVWSQKGLPTTERYGF